MEISVTEKIERAIIRALIEEVAAAGYTPDTVWDGGEYVTAPDADAAIAAVFAVDESTIHFRRSNTTGPPRKNRGVFLVCGNGEDIISDWHCGDTVFDAAVQRACDRATRVEITA